MAAHPQQFATAVEAQLLLRIRHGLLRSKAMSLLLIIIILILLFGGGGFYGYNRGAYGTGGLGGILVLLLVVIVAVYLVNSLLLVPATVGPVTRP
jgi:hypothetical protein